MKLSRLRLEQFRQFRRPFELTDLEPGLNLVVGPNESGKSTLVRAIRAAFFERHRSKIEDLLPWGDSAAAPTVELGFEHDNSHWSLTKSFFKRKRCDLEIDGNRYSGEEAEEKLAEFLGYNFSGKGASKAEHWGIPGLLWVEQGAGQEVEQAVKHAGDHLKSALDSLLGEVASSGGDDIIQQVEKARGELLTAGGKPRGDYAGLEKNCENLRREVAELDEHIAAYRDQVDRLDRLRRDHQRDEQERPWEELRRRLAEVQSRYGEIQVWQQQQQQDRQVLEGLQSNLALREEQQRETEIQTTRLRQREEAYREANRALEETRGRAPALQRAVDEAREGYERAKTAVQQAREQELRQRLATEVEQFRERLQVLDGQLHKARGYQQELEVARETLQANHIDSAAVDKLGETERQLEEKTIRSRAVATRLDWQLEEGAILQLGEQSLSGDGNELLLERADLAIPGVGTIAITPGGEDLGKLRRSLERLQGQRDEQLARLQVPSLEEAQQRRRRQADAKASVERLTELLSSVAPTGVEQLVADRTALHKQLAEKRAQLDALPGPQEEVPSLEAAEEGLNRAEQDLSHAESALSAHTLEREKAQLHRDNTEREWQNLREELDSPERRERLQQQQTEIADLRQRITALEERLAQRQQQIDKANPDFLQQDIERLTDSAEQKEQAHRDRRTELEGLRRELAARGAEGLEETRDQRAAELEHLERRYNELHRRARALDLLLELLREKRQALTRRLQAPLQKHLDHYLRVLFPDARLEVDENLIPGRFRRGDELGPMEELSFGAREQMGLISRLAYADLLREAGRPTLIILDDTLVHSDRDRLEQMKRILFDAARRHQILLFTCHPASWDDLGVQPRDLEALKAGGAV